MSDYVSVLREQLVDAAAREQVRRAPRLVLPTPRTLALAAVAAAVLAFVVLATAGGLRDEPPVTAQPTPAPTPQDGSRELFGGSLEPGVRYRTRAFVPALSFVPGDDQWFVRDATQPGFLALERRNRTDRPGSELGPRDFLVFTYLPEVYDPGVRQLQASRTAAPADLHAWLRDHPDLRVGPAEPVAVAGVPADAFDVRVRFSRPAHGFAECFDDRFQFRPPERIACTRIGPNAVFADGTRLRVLLLQTEPDPLLVVLTAMPWGDIDRLERPAAALLDSLRIGIR